MTPLEILKAARAKIEKPENWGKGARARNRDCDTCCAAEAVEEAAPGEYEARKKAFATLRCAAGLDEKWRAITSWNDTPERTHAEVLATFNLAIALERNMPRNSASGPSFVSTIEADG